MGHRVDAPHERRHLAAGGHFRTPTGEWTNIPVVVGSGFGDMSHLVKDA